MWASNFPDEFDSANTVVGYIIRIVAYAQELQPRQFHQPQGFDALDTVIAEVDPSEGWESNVIKLNRDSFVFVVLYVFVLFTQIDFFDPPLPDEWHQLRTLFFNPFSIGLVMIALLMVTTLLSAISWRKG